MDWVWRTQLPFQCYPLHLSHGREHIPADRQPNACQLTYYQEPRSIALPLRLLELSEADHTSLLCGLKFSLQGAQNGHKAKDVISPERPLRSPR
ncbi:hypothetical protein C8Q77DRAFT_575967 [Trametes polyzona]|nr:hypothetical protein C8Q77DRAFT_575967 [Trametes polyzona]